MNCQETRDLFEDAIDHALAGARKRKFDLHLQRCPDCRARYDAEVREHAALFRMLNGSGDEERLPSPERMTARLLAARRQAATRTSWLGRMPRWARIAAALALFAGAALFAAQVVEGVWMDNAKSAEESLSVNENKGDRGMESEQNRVGSGATALNSSEVDQTPSWGTRLAQSVKTGVAATLSSAVLATGAAPWYESPMLKAKVDVGYADTDPHFINLSEDGAYLMLDVHSWQDAKPCQLYSVVDLKALSGTVGKSCLGEAFGKDLFGTTASGTGNGWKGGAISARLGLMIPGSGTTDDAKYTSLAMPAYLWSADDGMACALSGFGGRASDGMDFNADGTRLYANYRGQDAKILVYDVVALKAEHKVTLLATIDLKAKNSAVTHVRNLSCYAVGGKDLVYFGEGSVGTDNASVYVYDPESDELVTLVTDAGRISSDIMNVKVSGLAAGQPMLYVQTEKSGVLVYALSADGKSLVSNEPVTAFSVDEIAALSGLDAVPANAKFRSFEVTDDGTTAFLCHRSDGETYLTVVIGQEPAAPMTVDWVLDANDGYGESAFSSGAHWWSNALSKHAESAPEAGKTYRVSSSGDERKLRTPHTAETKEIAFGGDALVLGKDASATMGKISQKSAGPSLESCPTITYKNLYLVAGIYRHDSGPELTDLYGRIGGKLTVCSRADAPVRFESGEKDGRTFQIDATVVGDPGTGLKLLGTPDQDDKEIHTFIVRFAGDMSGYFGSLDVNAKVSLYLPSEHSVASVTVRENAVLGATDDAGTMVENADLKSGSAVECRWSESKGAFVPVELRGALTKVAPTVKLSLVGHSGTFPAGCYPLLKIGPNVQGVSVASFAVSDATLGDGLTSRLVETRGGDGVRTVSLYVGATITMTGKNDGWDLMATPATWSDGQTPHAGAAYLVDATAGGRVLRTSSATEEAQTFGGDILTLKGSGDDKLAQLYLKSKTATVPLLRLEEASCVRVASYKDAEANLQYLNGRIEVAGTRSNPSRIESQLGRPLMLNAALCGSGYLRFWPVKSEQNEGFAVTLTADNSAFTGIIDARGWNHNLLPEGDRPVQLEISDERNLGGNPATFTYNALSLGGGAVVRALKSLTIDDSNRGILVWQPATFEVPEGATLDIAAPIAYSAHLTKTGAGSLQLRGASAFSNSDNTGTQDKPVTNGCNTLEVAAGTLEVASGVPFTNLCLEMMTGTTLRLLATRDASVIDSGIDMTGKQAGFKPSGTVRVEVDRALAANRKSFKVAICTVRQDEVPAVKSALKAARIDGYSVSIVEETVSNGVRFSCVGKTGLLIIFR